VGEEKNQSTFFWGWGVAGLTGAVSHGRAQPTPTLGKLEAPAYALHYHARERAKRATTTPRRAWFRAPQGASGRAALCAKRLSPLCLDQIHTRFSISFIITSLLFLIIALFTLIGCAVVVCEIVGGLDIFSGYAESAAEVKKPVNPLF
jgi:hypothetical protein